MYMMFLFDIAVGWVGETACYSVFDVRDGKYKIQLQHLSFPEGSVPAEITIWKQKGNWKTSKKDDELLAQYVGEEIDQYHRTRLYMAANNVFRVVFLCKLCANGEDMTAANIGCYVKRSAA